MSNVGPLKPCATCACFCCVVLAALSVPSGCSRVKCEGDASKVLRPASWTELSHCPGVDPDYQQVFSVETVHRFDITISQKDHDATLYDMDEKFSGGMTTGDLDDAPKPIWVSATIHYDNNIWTHVGMRYKGHSSLKAAWQSGVRKLSFILDFDHFEDQYPDLENQRFFGFNKLSFSNGFNDPSLIREKVSAEIFRAAGVPAAQSTFAAIYLDWGNGPVYLGLYTVVEDPCDNMMQTQIGAAGGHLYKPWGNAARWLSSEQIGPDEIAPHFESCKTDEVNDRSDVIAAIDALHQDRGNSEKWRAQLEDVFDVQSFIRALAVNQVIMNWDSYGCMHHNYFVYANPADGGRFVWFPWDLNESMLYRKQGGCPPPGSILLEDIVFPDETSETDTDWPLIQFILSDETYHESYIQRVRETADIAFSEQSITSKMEVYHALIAPYVVGPTETESFPYTNCTSAEFKEALTNDESGLIPHVSTRRAAVAEALSEN